MSTGQYPTQYTEVNAIIEDLHAALQAILDTQWVGMYLLGSLALGDFRPEASDIDYLVVTDSRLSPELVTRLADLHSSLSAGPSRWGRELEGSYIPRKAVRRQDSADTRHPRIERYEALSIQQHDTDWVINRFVLREHGVTLSGPPPHSLIDLIRPDDLRRAVLDLLWWWELQLTETHRVEQSGYQAYAVLSMCRILYTLQHGTVVTKPVAAQWASDVLDNQWVPLIERALTWPAEPMNRLAETLDLIRYTLDHSRQYQTPPD
jgi:hypothetical protein